MQKDILLAVAQQSQADCKRVLYRIDISNVKFRLTNETASAGFIYRHIGELTNLLCGFFGYPTDVESTTLGQTDTGKEYNLDTSRVLFEQGYATLEKIINDTPDDDWLQEIETSWFGKLSRIKLFSITLFHNSHHCGQIASAIAKGKNQ